MIKKIFTYCLLLTGVLAQAQVSITANAPRVAVTGEEIQLVYTINAEPSEFRAPNLSAFNILAGPSRSSSSSISIMNGKVSQSVTITYIYVLQGKQAGKFSIDPVKITVDGKSYISNPVTIEVVSGGNTSSGGQQQTQQQNNTQTQNQQVDIPEDKVFLKVIVDKTSLYQGDYLTATVKFYSQLNVNDLGNLQLPKFNGVYSQEMEIPQISLNRENINGKIYVTGVIKQYYLFPQQSGDIVIDPFSIEAVVAQKAGTRSRTPFDDFWGLEPEASYQWVKKVVKSKPLKISVKALPLGAPASFKGAVGSYSFKASIDKNKLKTNDAVTLKAVISGTGNIKLIDPFEPQLPADFETFDPKTNVTVKGVNGNKTFEFVMIPRHSGSYTIPALEFSYFDPQTRQYKTLRSDDFPITVEKGKDDEDSKNVFVLSNRDDVKYLGKDILFIKPGPVPGVKNNKWFFGSLGFYLAYGVASFVFLLFVILKRKQIIENANIARVRNKRASKQAKKRLKTASKCMADGNKEIFYEEILKALWGYLGDKLNIPASELSREKVLEILAGKGTGDELTATLNNILDSCELARYAPAAAPSDLKEIYNKSAELISAFENMF
jgi:hypothetical protein